jgi:hypothetical protein
VVRVAGKRRRRDRVAGKKGRREGWQKRGVSINRVTEREGPEPQFLKVHQRLQVLDSAEAVGTIPVATGVEC